MAGWELALVIVALTYMMVNIVALFVQIKMLNEWKGIFSKTLKLGEKLLGKYEKLIDEAFDDEL